MSERTTVPGDGAWHQIGTGPATVQLLSPDVGVLVECATTAPTGIDGLVLGHTYSTHYFTLSEAIWAQVVQAGSSAVVAVQPEVA